MEIVNILALPSANSTCSGKTVLNSNISCLLYRFQINFLSLQSTPMFCSIVISLVQSTQLKAFS